MPSLTEADQLPPAPLVLRLALRAYPAADRRGYGDELLEAALELAVDDSTRAREVGGLLRGGLEARTARWRLGLRAVGLRGALRTLTVPLTAMAIAIWGCAAGARIAGAEALGGAPAVTLGAVLLLGLLALLALGVARAQRGVATVAAALLFLQVFTSALWYTARGGTLTASPPIHLQIGWWWFGPNITWSLLPLLGLLVPSCWSMRPAPPRVPGIPRPVTEWSAVRMAVLLAPAAVLALVLVTAPQYVLVAGGLETTQLPGLLFLMVLVGALWAAVAVPRGREAHAAAAALAGLALVPTVSYGAAKLLISPVGGLVENRDLWVALGLVVAVFLIVLAAVGFTLILAHVGLRAVDRKGGSPLTVGHAISIGPDGPPAPE